MGKMLCAFHGKMVSTVEDEFSFCSICMVRLQATQNCHMSFGGKMADTQST